MQILCNFELRILNFEMRRWYLLGGLHREQNLQRSRWEDKFEVTPFCWTGLVNIVNCMHIH